MAEQIRDGTGTGHLARVNGDNRLQVNAVSSGRAHDRAEVGDSYYVTSSYSATGNDEIFYIKNDSELALHIDHMRISTDTAALFTVFKVTDGTAAGTALTAVNNLFSSGKTAEATILGDTAVTGGLTGNAFHIDFINSNTDLRYGFDGSIILEKGDQLAITVDSNAMVNVNVQFYFIQE